MLAPVDEPLIAALELDAAASVADIGCGGGGTTLAIARRVPAGSVVHGFDISPDLIALARRRAAGSVCELGFEVADMAAAAPDRPYARLVSRFGVMFFEDAPSAFKNLVRWLEPSGRFTFAVWGPPAENPWLTTVRDVVARLVDIPPLDPDAPGPFRYANADKLLRLLERCGFSKPSVVDWRGALPIGGMRAPAAAAQFALASFSSFGELLAQAGGGARSEAERALTERFASLERDGAVWLDACVHLVNGSPALASA